MKFKGRLSRLKPSAVTVTGAPELTAGGSARTCICGGYFGGSLIVNDAWHVATNVRFGL
jgi:hypothetical protein